MGKRALSPPSRQSIVFGAALLFVKVSVFGTIALRDTAFSVFLGPFPNLRINNRNPVAGRPVGIGILFAVLMRVCE
jgi:hypothetical protein